MRSKFFQIFVILSLVGSYFLLPKYGFTSSFYPLSSHLLYPLSHANIWHLMANCLCLYLLRCPLHIVASYTIAVLCSFLPCPLFIDMLFFGGSEGVTYGFSGVLFAIVGIAWGRAGRFREMLSRNKWFLIIPAFIPHINFLIHLYCLIAGYAYGRWVFASRTGKKL